MAAAAIAPLMAMVGGGVDMGRSYLAQNRLQQACDAGVLAARKRVGTEVAITGEVPPEAAESGERFFNLNFRAGAYGTEQRDFVMTLEEDYAVTGTASVVVPTTIMAIFGFTQVPISVSCQSNLTMSNTDIMMVMDVTGSMSETNPGDPDNRLAVLKATVKGFHAQIAAASSPQTRVRYGFVPYSTNVNVGSLLKDDWVVDEWQYQSRKQVVDREQVDYRTIYRNWTNISGTQSADTTYDSFPATYVPATGETGSASYNCNGGSAPSDTHSSDYVLLSESSVEVSDPDGTEVTKRYRKTTNGTDYWISRSGETCHVRMRTYSNFVQEYDQVTEPYNRTFYKWQYKQLTLDVSDWRTSSNGCMEERSTYEITDYNSVDFSQARDLDIDAVPEAGNSDTQWRPMYPGIVYARSLNWDTTGSWTKPTKTTTANYLRPGGAGFAACPAPARKLATLTSGQLDSYLAGIQPAGSTYHDIGMIWGGRLLSPTGLFSAENANVSAAKQTERHMIFLTDGETDALDVSYSTYGLEPLDERRWDPSSSLSLDETIERRFAVACEEVKKRNITVWVIGFGTSLNPVMTQCAGEGHYFVADDAAQLNETFASIAAQLGSLRITR